MAGPPNQPKPSEPQEPQEPQEPLTIDCAECVMRQTEACDDCVVSFVVGHRPGDALVIDVEEARAVRLLSCAGLVPGLRHLRRSG